RALNGMSHGAAGFAYALALLADATNHHKFADAALRCIAFENASYDPQRNNWPYFFGNDEPLWPCQWCHGAAGIGIARAAIAKRSQLNPGLMMSDVFKAVDGTKSSWRPQVDTLCCGALGSIEFLCEAANTLRRDDLREYAAQCLAVVVADATQRGDYRWNFGH